MTTSYHYSAPGNSMVMGEHAVLQGELAIGCAVATRMHCKLTPRQDTQVHISSALGEYTTDLNAYQPSDVFRFICRAIESFELKQGFDMTIHSAFSDQVGLGSSAAATLTSLACLTAWQGGDLSPNALLTRALFLVKQVQGRASGTDLAASTYGGLIAFNPETFKVDFLPHPPGFQLYYVGYKIPTPQVIAHVAAKAQQVPELYTALYRLIGQTTAQAIQAAQREEWTLFGELMNLHQGLQDALSTNNRDLSQLVYALRAHPQLIGVKISGSGLGDSVLAMKATIQDVFPEIEGIQSIPFQIDNQGLVREKG
jgi:mevalonate kinase